MPADQHPVPTWIVILGAFFGGTVLLFFMGLLLLGVYGHPIPCDSRFLVVVIMSFGAALSVSFLGGAAAASGHLPLPFGNVSPIKFSVAGGVGIFVILIFVGQYTYMRDSCGETAITADINAMKVNMANDELDAAWRKADDVLKASRENYRALNTKGSISFYRGDFRAAVDYFDRAHRAQPKDPNITMNLADAKVEIGAIEEAIDLYDSIKSSSIDWSYAKGRALLLAGRFEDAYKLLQSVPSDFRLGTARLLGAAALLQIANKEPQQTAKDRVLKDARTEFGAACAQSSEYWNGILKGQRREKKESYQAIIKILEPIYDHKTPC